MHSDLNPTHAILYRVDNKLISGHSLSVDVIIANVYAKKWKLRGSSCVNVDRYKLNNHHIVQVKSRWICIFRTRQLIWNTITACNQSFSIYKWADYLCHSFDNGIHIKTN